MVEVTSSTFKDAFERVTQEQMQVLLENWSSQPRFTAYVKDVMMPRVASILGCNLLREHPFMTQRIDLVMIMPPSFKTDRLLSENVLVAIEHENNFSGSYEEVSKLEKFNAPLGVVITYVGDKKLRTINEYNEIMSQSERRVGNRVRGELLVIFGPYGMQRPSSLDWDYWAYQVDQFKRIS